MDELDSFPTDLLRGTVIEMEGSRYLWTLPWFAALGTVGIYLQLARSFGKNEESEQSSGVGISLAALAGIAAALSKLPLEPTEPAPPAYHVPLLMALGCAAALCAAVVVVSRTNRTALRALSALCVVLAGLLGFRSWIIALGLLAIGSVFAVGTLRVSPKKEAGSDVLEPFLSCVAGGLLVVTLLTTFAGAAVASSRFVSDVAAKAVKEAVAEPETRESSGTGPIVAGTGVLLLLGLVAAFRFRKGLIDTEGRGAWQ